MLAVVDSVEKRTIKKIRFRILALVFLLYIISFIDRANVAYAKLPMSVDLGFSEAAYGLGLGHGLRTARGNAASTRGFR